MIFAVVVALLPEACAKLTGKKPQPVEVDPPPPPPPPPPSATTPPIYHPPETTSTTPTGATSAPPPGPSPELVKARLAADGKDFKKVKALLEKKVRGGKCTPEETQLVFRACVALKDKACSDAVKAKHPEDIAE